MTMYRTIPGRRFLIMLGAVISSLAWPSDQMSEAAVRKKKKPNRRR